VILTAHYDRSLLRRAIQKALGEHVQIVGGSVGDFAFAAHGAAGAALQRKDSWERVHGRKSLVGPGHDEL
jgi:hypothetical protein